MYNIVAEKYFDTISTGILEELTPENKEALRRLLTSPVFEQAARSVMHERQVLVQTFIAVDLSTQEGVMRAAMRQGIVQGITLAIEHLISFSHEEGNEPNEEEEN